MNWHVWGLVLLLVFFVPATNRAQEAGYRFMVSGDSLTSNVPMNEISPQAFRHFEKQFGVVASTTWYKYGNGYLVRFSALDSSQYYIYISRRGILSKTIISFTVSNVPREVRAAMAAYDRGGYILFAGELLEGEKPLYEVGLADASMVRIVDMKDGNVQMVYEYKRDDESPDVTLRH
jgi:hypothetical protein